MNQLRFPAKLDLLNLPTPVEIIDPDRLLWIKRDDLTGLPYGGNKPRKLEFLLAEARQKNAKTIVTTGATGSNHCLATTVYACQLGFNVELIMFPQPETEVVRHHFSMVQKLGAKITLGTDYTEFERLKKLVMNRVEEPYFIPSGGSTGTGCLGYIKAAFELLDQVRLGILPEPEVIYCAAGTLGTLSGLAVGFALAGQRIPVRGVRVVDSIVTNVANLDSLINETTSKLKESNPGLTIPPISGIDVKLVEGYFGDGYGVSTCESLDAIDWMVKRKAYVLDPTYTSKTFAAVLDRTQKNNSSGPVLYWHTFDPGNNLSEFEPPKGII